MTLEQALERIAELEGENLWLRERLRERFDANAIIGPKLGLTPGQGCILILLYEAKGRIVSRWFLDDNMPLLKNKERQGDRAVEVQIHHLRKKLGRGAIENVWGRGFRLSEEGRRLVGEALGGAAS